MGKNVCQFKNYDQNIPLKQRCPLYLTDFYPWLIIILHLTSVWQRRAARSVFLVILQDGVSMLEELKGRLWATQPGPLELSLWLSSGRSWPLLSDSAFLQLYRYWECLVILRNPLPLPFLGIVKGRKILLEFEKSTLWCDFTIFPSHSKFWLYLFFSRKQKMRVFCSGLCQLSKKFRSDN